MSNLQISKEITLLPADNQRLSNFCGQFDAHLRQIEKRLQVDIANRGNHFKVSGIAEAVKAAVEVMKKLFAATEFEVLTPENIHLSMQDASVQQLVEDVSEQKTEVLEQVYIKTKRGVIKGRGENQQGYLRKITNHDINLVWDRLEREKPIWLLPVLSRPCSRRKCVD